MLNSIFSLFQVNQAEYFEFWNTQSDEFTAFEDFLMSILPQDTWNIDFNHYDKLADLEEGWDYRLIEGYDESQDYI